MTPSFYIEKIYENSNQNTNETANLLKGKDAKLQTYRLKILWWLGYQRNNSLKLFLMEIAFLFFKKGGDYPG